MEQDSKPEHNLSDIYVMSEQFKKNFVEDRMIKSVPLPVNNKVTKQQLFPDGKTPDTEMLMKLFLHQGLLEHDAASELISKAAELLSQEPNVLHLCRPIVVVGDIHGQFYDLPTIFNESHSMPSHKYLFLGDYIDRGWFSCECILYLYALKVKFPNHCYLLRGNHESERMAEFFTFKIECVQKYGQDIYKQIIKSFFNLPLAAVIDKLFFCVHGGISPQLNKISDIDNIDRKKEPETRGLMCDLLWSDPTDLPRFCDQSEDFVPNPVRKCSYHYNANACLKFIQQNQLLCIFRAHEVQVDGFKRFMAPSVNFPVLITVFSAPNYLDNYNNLGGIIVIPSSNKIDMKTFSENPHPYCLPNRADVFEWSTPFVIKNVNQIFTHILTICSSEQDSLPTVGMSTERRDRLKKKIMALGKINNACEKLNDERMLNMKLKGLSTTAISENSEIMKEVSAQSLDDMQFDDVKKLDRVNESLPDINASSS